MRRTGLLVGGWALATLLALVLGLQSVSAISDSVTGHPRASLSPASVRAALQRSTSSSDTESSSSSETTASVAPANGSSSGSGSSTSSSTDDAAATTGNGGDHDSGSSSSSSSSTEAQSSSSESDQGSSSDGSQSSASFQDKTYQLIGGSVGVRFENSAAHLLWATPNSGFSVESSGSSSSVDVRFRSDSHESRLQAFWDNGPQQTIEESG